MSAAFRKSATSGLVSSWSSAVKGKSKALPTNWTRPLSTSSNACRPAAAVSSNDNAGASTTLASSGAEFTQPSSATQSPTVISSTQSALSLLKSQPSHYIVASIVGRTFMLTPRDVFTIPRLRDVEVGDVLELERIHEVGSRDYTLRAQDPMSTRRTTALEAMRRAVSVQMQSEIDADAEAEAESETTEMPLKESKSWATRLHPSGLAHVGAVLPTSTVRARCVVVEHTKGALETIVKKKRRKGYEKTIKHKQTYTRLRLEGIKFGEGEAQ